MPSELQICYDNKQFSQIIDILKEKDNLSDQELFYFLQSHYNLGNFKKAMEIADKHLIHTKKESPIFVDLMYSAGAIYAVGVEFKKSIQSYEKGLYHARKMNNVKAIANGLMDIGNSYADQGELEKAREYIEESLKIFKDSNDYVGEAYGRANLGYIKKDMGYFKEALLDLQEAEIYLLEEENKVHLVILSKNIIEVLVELDMLNSANKYLKKIQNIKRGSKNPRIEHVYNFAYALILKSSSRMKEKVKSMELFSEIINNVEYTPNRLIAIRHICDLLLQEYKLFEEKEVLVEIKKYISKMHEISKEKNVYPYLISSLILKAKLEIILHNYHEAEKLFSSASIIAKEKNLGYYTILAERESKQLKESLVEMKNLVDGYSEILEEQTMEDIFDYLKFIRGKM